MIKLERTHNPKTNSQLISRITGENLDIQKVVANTNELFIEISKGYTPVAAKTTTKISSFFTNFRSAIRKLALTKSALDEVKHYKTMVDRNGNVYPEWMSQLNQEYKQLLHEIQREVHIEDFGAVGDGKTDCTEAFRMAIGNGRVKIHIPEGVFITKELRLPSWTCLSGAGKGKTIIKLHDSASKGSRLVTNRNHRIGNRNIYVKGMTLDWNVERLGNAEKTSTWGNHSSCLLLANVKFGWVKDVEAINPGLHCFDISSTLYNYYGDGYRARGGSEFVWLDNLTGYGFGDDGITTHHSDNIFISNCHMCDPSGKAHKKGFSNSNGIEIDDGSRNVWLWNNSSARCFGGVEIKAHHTSSAANHVVIIGHLSVNDNRSFNFRHIGHHKDTDPESKTAINIKAANLVSINPVHTDLYANSSPRALVISAYKNVAINHFTAIGDPQYNYDGEPVMAIQYRSRNIILKHIALKGFIHAGYDIKVFGGKNRADNVKITQCKIKHSAPRTLHIGRGVKHAEIQNLTAEAVNGEVVIEADQDGAKILDLTAKGFQNTVHYRKSTETMIP